MSIKVKTQRLVARHNDLPDEIKVDKINEVVEDYATEIASALGGLKCKHHSRKISYITLIADRKDTFLIKKKFCCPEFEAFVSAKIAH